MTVEQALNNLKGTVVDYDMNSNATLFALVKSEAGNYSIRQSFRNYYGEYKGWTIVKKLNKVDETIATIEFNDFMSQF